jgi:hypothetical protein
LVTADTLPTNAAGAAVVAELGPRLSWVGGGAEVAGPLGTVGCPPALIAGVGTAVVVVVVVTVTLDATLG